MTGIPAGGGMTDVQARIAAIQSKLGQFAPRSSAPAFTLASAPAAGTAGTPLAAAPPAPSAPAAPTTPTTAGGTAPSGDVAAATAKLTAALPEAGKPWAGPIAEAATKHGVDPGLLAALVQHESGFDPNARSHAGAIGLGQLMPGTAAGLGVDPTDPAQNLDGAAKYLKQQLDRFGSADLALAAYNAGPGRVQQAGGVPNITETRNYVARVTATWEQYR